MWWPAGLGDGVEEFAVDDDGAEWVLIAAVGAGHYGKLSESVAG